MSTQSMFAPTYTIGQFAKLSHISIKTLRYYDQEGILKPRRKDGGTYRAYSFEQLEQARMLQQLRFVHLPLHALRRFMLDPTPEQQRRLLDEHAQRLEDEIAILSNRLRTIRRKRDHPRDERPYEVRVDDRPSVPMVFVACPTTLVSIEETRAAAFSRLEAHLARHGTAPAGPPTCFYLPGDAPRDEGHACDMYASFEVAAPVPEQAPIRLGRTPAGTWYSARHHGLYEYLGYAKTPIFQRAREAGFTREQHPEHVLYAEAYLVGPWDTPDLGRLQTEVRWLMRADTLGALGEFTPGRPLLSEDLARPR